MSKHDGCFRGFSHTGAAWYCSSVMMREAIMQDGDSVHIGMYHPDGGTTGEFSVTWHRLPGIMPPSPRLEVFDDAWEMLASRFFDVLSTMAKLDNRSIQPAEFCEVLRGLGIVDLTRRVRP